MPRLQEEHFPDRRHCDAEFAHSALDLVLGCLPGDNTNARPVRPAIPAPARTLPLRDGFPNPAQAAFRNVRPDRDTIGGPYPVEVDECLIGGKTRGKGRGVHEMTNVIAAVEVRLRKEGEDRAATRRKKHEGGKPLKRLIYAGRLRLRVIPNRSAAVVT